jgi:hypothetical protein
MSVTGAQDSIAAILDRGARRRRAEIMEMADAVPAVHRQIREHPFDRQVERNVENEPPGGPAQGVKKAEKVGYMLEHVQRQKEIVQRIGAVERAAIDKAEMCVASP